MLNSVMTLCLTVSLGQAPIENDNYSANQQAIGQAMDMGSVDPGLPAYGTGEGPGGHFSAGLTGSIEEELYPYDRPEPWIHGYWQEIPAYGGYAAFRPYNYKHVLAQSQAAGGWGMSAQMPYSQQFWHRYQQRAEMRSAAIQTPRRQSYTNRPVQWQAPVSQKQIQQTSARSYRQPAPVRQVQRQFNRPAPRRRVTQQQSTTDFTQRLAAADKKVKAYKTQKKSWKLPFFK